MTKAEKNKITMKIGFWTGKKKVNPKLSSICDREIKKLKEELNERTILHS